MVSNLQETSRCKLVDHVIMLSAIYEFRGQYYFLSNYYSALEEPIELDGLLFPSVEHAYQAAKTTDEVKRRQIQQAKSPGNAKYLGRSLKSSMRKDWDSIKLQVMRALIEQKFTKNKSLCDRLVKTGNKKLIEGNNWNDTFFGMVKKDEKWIGENNLGKILMDTRTKLSRKSTEDVSLTSNCSSSDRR